MTDLLGAMHRASLVCPQSTSGAFALVRDAKQLTTYALIFERKNHQQSRNGVWEVELPRPCRSCLQEYILYRVPHGRRVCLPARANYRTGPILEERPTRKIWECECLLTVFLSRLNDCEAGIFEEPGIPRSSGCTRPEAGQITLDY